MIQNDLWHVWSWTEASVNSFNSMVCFMLCRCRWCRAYQVKRSLIHPARTRHCPLPYRSNQNDSINWWLFSCSTQIYCPIHITFLFTDTFTLNDMIRHEHVICGTMGTSCAYVFHLFSYRFAIHIYVRAAPWKTIATMPFHSLFLFLSNYSSSNVASKKLLERTFSFSKLSINTVGSRNFPAFHLWDRTVIIRFTAPKFA